MANLIVHHRVCVAMQLFFTHVHGLRGARRRTVLVRAVIMACAVLILLAGSRGSEPYLVKDINPTFRPGSSYPREFVHVAGSTYFVAEDAAHGAQLWVTDGSAEGTKILPLPGALARGPEKLVNVRGTMFFAYHDALHGIELFKIDGPGATAVLVKDIRPGIEGADPAHLTGVEGMLFFIADDGIHGEELWRSNGTREGTVMVRDIRTGPQSGVPSYRYGGLRLVAAGSEVHFIATDDAHGYELWKSDGTEKCTSILKDIYPGSGSSQTCVERTALTSIDGAVLFGADDGAHGCELWLTDGTEDGTVLVKDITPGPAGSQFEWMMTVGETVLLAADDGIHGTELWNTDGTEEGTVLVKDIRKGADGSMSHSSLSPPPNIAVLGDTLYFAANDGVTGYELWKSDGTTDGTLLVRDSFPGWDGSGPRELTQVGNLVFFRARCCPSTDPMAKGWELWRSDGTENGTVMVVDIHPGPGDSFPADLVNVEGMLLFSANDGVRGRELWKSSGTEAGTELVKNMASDVSSSGPRIFCGANGTLFFVADDGVHGQELWKSDGTHTGTALVRDICPDHSCSGPDSLTRFGGHVFFSASDGHADDAAGAELWKSDGTEAGTRLVADIEPGPADSYARNLVVAGDGLFFLTHVWYDRRMLWRTDGTEDGTVLLAGPSLPKDYSSASFLTGVNESIFFAASTDSWGSELWMSDGTVEGTGLVADIWPGPLSARPRPVATVRETLYFLADDGQHGREVWLSDGTRDGTLLVADIRAGPASSFGKFGPHEFAVVDETAFFWADDGESGKELWRTNGTERETVLVRDIFPGSGDGAPDLSPGMPSISPVGAALDGALYFTANDGVHGLELWRSDGTDTGTGLVADIQPGPTSSVPRDSVLATHCGPIVFVAFNSDDGTELWQTDGTHEGTFPISNIAAGNLGAAPSDLHVAGTRLFFAAIDETTGRELWALDLADLYSLGDLNCDGLVDLSDHAEFTFCLAGPSTAIPPGCEAADGFRDSHIDLRDAAVLQLGFLR